MDVTRIKSVSNTTTCTSDSTVSIVIRFSTLHMDLINCAVFLFMSFFFYILTLKQTISLSLASPSTISQFLLTELMPLYTLFKDRFIFSWPLIRLPGCLPKSIHTQKKICIHSLSDRLQLKAYTHQRAMLFESTHWDFICSAQNKKKF